MRYAMGAVLVCTVLAASPMTAAEGRYQAVVVPEVLDAGSAKVFLLDTESGHLWTWNEVAATPGSAGGRLLIYQGQLRPGKQMGDVINTQEWRDDAAPPPAGKKR